MISVTHQLSFLRVARTWILIVLLFTLWAFLKPPFSAPDEFAHYSKALSMPHAGWNAPEESLVVNSHQLSPLFSYEPLAAMAFHKEISLTPEQIETLRHYRWAETREPVTVRSTAFSFPPLSYWLLFVPAQTSIEILNLSPLFSLYAYRIFAALLSATLFATALVLISRSPLLAPYYDWTAAFILLNPMLCFICSSVNSDYLSIPLSLIVLVVAVRMLEGKTSGIALFVSSLALLFTKPTAIILVIAVGGGALLLLLRNRHDGAARRIAIISAVSLAIAWLSFYRISSPQMPMAIMQMTLTDWFLAQPRRFVALGAQYLGVLGWLDTRVATPWYLVILALFGFSASLVPWRTLCKRSEVTFLLAVAALFACAHFFLEAYTVRHGALALQGRYFLPISLCISLIGWHKHAMVRRTIIFSLLLLQLLLMNEMVDRYYAGDMGLLFALLTPTP